MRLMMGDCLDRMAEIEDGSVDLTVTSPPYDNLRTYNDTLNDWTAEKWQAIIRELFRATKDGGVVVWVVGDATIKGSETGTSFRQALYAMECGFRLHDTMIWQKTDAPPQVKSARRYTAAYEFMFIWTKGAPAAFNPLEEATKTAGSASFRPRCNTQRSANGTYQESRDELRSGKTVKATKPLQNVWSRATQGRGAVHPAQFPEHIARDQILSWSNPGDTVLDPFLGSGTTGKMALETCRNFVGIERDPTYFQIAKNRIEEAQRRLL